MEFLKNNLPVPKTFNEFGEKCGALSAKSIFHLQEQKPKVKIVLNKIYNTCKIPANYHEFIDLTFEVIFYISMIFMIKFGILFLLSAIWITILPFFLIYLTYRACALYASGKVIQIEAEFIKEFICEILDDICKSCRIFYIHFQIGYQKFNDNIKKPKVAILKNYFKEKSPSPAEKKSTTVPNKEDSNSNQEKVLLSAKIDSLIKEFAQEENITAKAEVLQKSKEEEVVDKKND